jgi:hypothetical protein
MYQRVSRADQADVSLTIASPDESPTRLPSPVRVTAALCPDVEKRQAWNTDLFVGPGVSPVPHDAKDVVLLETPSRQPLAVRSGAEPKVVIVSPSLFDERATFWKQAQFLPLMACLLGAASKTERVVTSCYGNLNTMLDHAVQAPPPESTLHLYPILLGAILVVMVIEVLCFYRGKIV